MKHGASQSWRTVAAIAAIATVTTTAMEEARAADVCVWVISGQSNANGYGTAAELPPAIQAYLGGASNAVPMNHLVSTIPTYPWRASYGWLPLAVGTGGPEGSYFGTEIPIGYTLAQSPLSRGQGCPKTAIMKFSQGSTYLETDWNATQPGGQKLWPTFQTFTNAALAQLQSAGLTYEVRGVVWIQGESDSAVASAAASYEQNLTNLVSAMRTHFASPALDIYVNRISAKIQSNGAPTAYLQQVRQAQQAVALADAHTYLIDSDDLTLLAESSGALTYKVHYDGASILEIGQRVAARALAQGTARPAARAKQMELIDAGNFMLGWQFTTGSKPLHVEKLGVLDSGADGLNEAHAIGIWRVSDGQLVAWSQVGAGTAGTLTDNFRYTSQVFGTTTLQPQTTYRVAALYPHAASAGGDLWGIHANDLEMNLPVSYDGPVTEYTSQLTYPSLSRANSSIEMYGPAYFGANFIAHEVAPSRPAVRFDQVTPIDAGGFMLGYELTTGANPIYVDRLGVFDQGLDGLSEAHYVGVWRVADQQLVAWSQLDQGTTETLIEGFRYDSVVYGTRTLQPNTKYRVAASFARAASAGGDPWGIQATSFRVELPVTYGGPVTAASTQFVYPSVDQSNSVVGTYAPAFFGANLVGHEVTP